MNRIDDYLCDQFQRLSDWLQVVFGIRCFMFALFCLYLSMGFFLCIYADERGFKRLVVVLISLNWLVSCHAVVYVTERSMRAQAASTVMNPSRLVNKRLRILVSVGALLILPMGIIAGNIYGVYLAVCFAFLAGYEYFMTCTPLPPGKSRLSILMGRIRSRLSLKPIPHGS